MYKHFMENWQIVSKQKNQSLKKKKKHRIKYTFLGSFCDEVVSQQRLIYEIFKEKFHLEFSRAITLIPNARKKVEFSLTKSLRLHCRDPL